MGKLFGKFRPPHFLIGFTNGDAFKSYCRKVFQETDLDHDGHLTLSELYVAVLKLYDTLNTVLPVHLKIPTTEHMQQTLAKHDLDQSGRLSFEEFLEVCRELVGAKRGHFWNSIFFKAAAVITVKLILIPLIAHGVKEAAKAAGASQKLVNKVPTGIVGFGLEMAAKKSLPLPM